MEPTLSEQMALLHAKLITSKTQKEIIALARDFGELIDAAVKKESALLKAEHDETTVSGTIKFTKKEVFDMDKTFKKHFILNGYIAHLIKRQSGTKGILYEIRYRRNGYNISVSSTNLAEAKRKFLEKTLPENIETYYRKRQDSNVKLFCQVFVEWYQFKSKTKVTKKVLQTHKAHFDRLPQDIQKKPIKAITMEDIASCLKELSERMYEEYRTLFNMLFTFAIANGYIAINPLSLIPFTRAQRNNRGALTDEEIIEFLRKINNPEFDKIRQMAYFYYFFGLRASELDEETRREGNFLIARNRKRKNGKVEYKKIPIPKLAETLIDWTYPLHRTVRVATAGKLFHLLLGEDKSAYNLRHTFSTICQKKVRQEIVEIWMGDSPQRLIGKVYTHFPDSFMREQMDLVEFPMPKNL